jgi:hypothetical protein
MQKNISKTSTPITSVIRRILLLYCGLAILSYTLRYLSGEFSDSTPWTFIAWTYAAIYAIVFEYSRRLCVPPRGNRLYSALFLAPALIQMGRDITLSIANRRGTVGESHIIIILFLLSGLYISFAILNALLLRSAYLARVSRPNIPALELEVFPPSTNGDSPITDIHLSLLGRGNSYVDRVIHSVLDRSAKSERTAGFSLMIMIALVMVGGMTSFGLWFLTHADRINTLEAERNKLILLQTETKDVLDKLGPGYEDAKAQLDRLIKFIDKNYSTSTSYEATLNKLSLQSQSNYADIAIRVTIAVLTIFLVQVFFAVYKYNRHLAIMLAAKAEALELVGSDDDARKELCREAVSIVKESVPGFGQSPRTPIEEAVRTAERIRKQE